MFENSGKKIKFIVKVFFWINWILILTVCGLTCGYAMKVNGDLKKVYITIGVLEVVLLPILSWIVSLFLYGYGELIDKTAEIANKLEKNKS